LVSGIFSQIFCPGALSTRLKFKIELNSVQNQLLFISELATAHAICKFCIDVSQYTFVCEQRDFQQQEFPTIAELASKCDWEPLSNLCRRRACPAEEFTAEYRGKTAVQWALHHGKKLIAEELEYFSVYCL
jgi:hypothetical protein